MSLNGWKLRKQEGPVVKIRLAYTAHSLPVEVEIEGDGFTPDMIPSVLGSVLASLESWFDTVMSKTHGYKGDVHEGACTPQPAPHRQSQNSQETQPT